MVLATSAIVLWGIDKKCWLNSSAVTDNWVSLVGLECLDKDWKRLQNLPGLFLSIDERFSKSLALVDLNIELTFFITMKSVQRPV